MENSVLYAETFYTYHVTLYVVITPTYFWNYVPKSAIYFSITENSSYLDSISAQGGRSCTGARVAPAEKFGLGQKF